MMSRDEPVTYAHCTTATSSLLLINPSDQAQTEFDWVLAEDTKSNATPLLRAHSHLHPQHVSVGQGSMRRSVWGSELPSAQVIDLYKSLKNSTKPTVTVCTRNRSYSKNCSTFTRIKDELEWHQITESTVQMVSLCPWTKTNPISEEFPGKQIQGWIFKYELIEAECSY